jgi:hypothetical protein
VEKEKDNGEQGKRARPPLTAAVPMGTGGDGDAGCIDWISTAENSGRDAMS